MERILQLVATLIALALGFTHPWMRETTLVLNWQLLLASIVIFILSIEILRLRHKPPPAAHAPPSTTGAPPPRKPKIHMVKFPDEGVQYAVEYYPDEQDVANHSRAGWPRCIEHEDLMQKKRSGHSGLGPEEYRCASCKLTLTLAQEANLATLAKADLIKSLRKRARAARDLIS